MGVLISLQEIEAKAFAANGKPECYRACDLGPFFGVTPGHISKVRRNNPARFPKDFYLGAGIYTKAGVLALAGRLRTKRAAQVSVEMLDAMFGGVSHV